MGARLSRPEGAAEIQLDVSVDKIEESTPPDGPEASGESPLVDDGAGALPWSLDPPAKRQRMKMATTDLSDRHVYLCAYDAIMAVQKRVVGCVPQPFARAMHFFPMRSLGDTADAHVHAVASYPQAWDGRPHE